MEKLTYALGELRASIVLSLTGAVSPSYVFLGIILGISLMLQGGRS
jgi:hypothetical protein